MAVTTGICILFCDLTQDFVMFLMDGFMMMEMNGKEFGAMWKGWSSHHVDETLPVNHNGCAMIFMFKDLS